MTPERPLYGNLKGLPRDCSSSNNSSRTGGGGRGVLTATHRESFAASPEGLPALPNPGSASRSIREPWHLCVRVAFAHYIGNRTEGASLSPFPQSPNPRSVKMTFRGSYFPFPKSNDFSVRSDYILPSQKRKTGFVPLRVQAASSWVDKRNDKTILTHRIGHLRHNYHHRPL